VSVTSIRGVVAEYRAAIILATRGYEVHWPLDPISTYDLLVGKDGVYRKVQVKKATVVSGRMRVKVCAPRNTKYKPGDFDLLLAVADDERSWLIPYTACHDRTYLSLDPQSQRGIKKPYDPTLWILP
jgi:hypothetical protein